MIGLQLVGIMFGVVMLYLTFVHSKKGQFTSREYVGWSGVWILLMGITLFPGLLDPILKGLTVIRAMDLYMSVGFLMLLSMVFYIYLIERTNQKKIETLSREVAFIKKQITEDEEEWRRVYGMARVCPTQGTEEIKV